VSKFNHTCGQELPIAIDILFNGRRRVTRRFELGKNDNVDDTIFAAYGADDPGEITSCLTGYADLHLIAPQKVVPSPDPKSTSILVQVFETLKTELMAEGPRVLGRDINDILVAKIPYIGLPGATGGLSIGDTFVVGGVTCVVSETEVEENDGFTRITYVARQVGIGAGGADELQVGGDELQIDSNERHTLIRRSTQASSGTFVPGVIGSTLVVDGVAYVLSEVKKTENAGYREITRVYLEATGTFVVVGPDIADREMNGLLRVRRLLVARAGTVPPALTVGVSQYVYGSIYTYLSAISDEGSDEAVTRITVSYMEEGIFDATTDFSVEDQLLYVTFRSLGVRFRPTALKAGSVLSDDPLVAFQGGDEASLRFAKISNVAGLRTYVTTVMMKLDGAALDPEEDNLLSSVQDWAQYQKPSLLELTNDGVLATPGPDRWIKVQHEETLTTEEGIVDDEGKPFSVKSWAYFRISYVPSDGSAPVIEAKGASGYLGTGSVSITNGTFANVDVISAAGVAGSDPSPEVFYDTENVVLEFNKGLSFITDEGVRWYRKRVVTLVGKFGDYLLT